MWLIIINTIIDTIILIVDQSKIKGEFYIITISVSHIRGLRTFTSYTRCLFLYNDIYYLSLLLSLSLCQNLIVSIFTYLLTLLLYFIREVQYLMVRVIVFLLNQSPPPPFWEFSNFLTNCSHISSFVITYLILHLTASFC